MTKRVRRTWFLNGVMSGVCVGLGAGPLLYMLIGPWTAAIGLAFAAASIVRTRYAP